MVYDRRYVREDQRGDMGLVSLESVVTFLLTVILEPATSTNPRAIFFLGAGSKMSVNTISLVRKVRGNVIRDIRRRALHGVMEYHPRVGWMG